MFSFKTYCKKTKIKTKLFPAKSEPQTLKRQKAHGYRLFGHRKVEVTQQDHSAKTHEGPPPPGSQRQQREGLSPLPASHPASASHFLLVSFPGCSAFQGSAAPTQRAASLGALALVF